MSLLVLTIGNSDLQFERSQIEQLNSQDLYLYKDENGDYLVCPDKSVVPLNVNRSYHQWLLLKESRNGAEALLNNMESVLHLLHFPLIEPIIKHLQEKKIRIEKIAFIYTDQKDEKFRKSDTVYTKEIIKQWLLKQFAELTFDDVGIDKVTDIDNLYPLFREKVRAWRQTLPEDAPIYLSDQGGIDQINQSIRLQLLQSFKSRVHILQKSEAADAKELVFPQLFIKDLNRQNIIKHVNDYDFDKIDDTLQPESWMVNLCGFAAARLSLQYTDILRKIEILNRSLKGTSIPPMAIWNWNKMLRLERNKITIRDLYVAAKIQYLNKRFNEFVWRIFTVYENLLREPIDNLAGKDTLKECLNPLINRNEENQKWINCLAEIDPTLIDNLKQEGIFINNPNRRAYSIICKMLLKEKRIPSVVSVDEIEILEKSLDKLSEKRNGIVHNMGHAKVSDLGEGFSSLAAYGFKTLDKWFGIKEMGDFTSYQKLILERYD